MIILILCSYTSADSIIVFGTDFSSKPDGWYADIDWTFNRPGARVQWNFSSGFGDAILSSIAEHPWTLYAIPDGADSVNIVIPKNLYASVFNGYIKLKCKMLVTGTGLITLWADSIMWEGTIIDSTPITYTIYNPPSGTLIGFSFIADAQCEDMGNVTLTWNLYSLTATAYGENIELDSSTWAEIKSIF